MYHLKSRDLCNLDLGHKLESHDEDWCIGWHGNFVYLNLSRHFWNLITYRDHFKASFKGACNLEQKGLHNNFYWAKILCPTIWSHENGPILEGRYGCKAKKICVGMLKIWNSFLCGISIIIYPSSCNCIYNINSCVRCIGWLYFSYTCERCNTYSTNKRSTKVVATFKKDTVG